MEKFTKSEIAAGWTTRTVYLVTNNQPKFTILFFRFVSQDSRTSPLNMGDTQLGTWMGTQMDTRKPLPLVTSNEMDRACNGALILLILLASSYR